MLVKVNGAGGCQAAFEGAAGLDWSLVSGVSQGGGGLDAAAARLGEDLDDHTQRMRLNRLVDGHGHCA